ncbi:MAG: glycosyltransferase family 39 protein [Terriglobia bacterium]
MILLRGLFPLIAIYGIGSLILWVTFGRRPGLQQILSLAFGCGTGVLSLLMFYLASWRVPLDRRMLGWLLGIALSSAVIAIFLIPANPNGFLGNDRAEKPWSRQEIGLFLLLGIAFLLVLADALSQPLLGFDSRAIWGMKAKILYEQQSIYTEDFFDPERLHAKNQYPLLIPLTEDWMYQLSGSSKDRIAKMIFPFFYLSLLAIAFEGLSLSLSRRASLWGTLLMAVVPAFLVYRNGGVASGYSDVPLTYFSTASTVLFYRWMRRPSNRDLVIAGLCGVGAVFTKNEGLPLMALSGMAFLGVTRWTKTPSMISRIKALLITLLGMVFCLLPWFLYRSRLPITDENFEKLLSIPRLLSGLNRVPIILLRLGQEYFLKPQVWGVLGILLLFALTERVRRRSLELEDVFLLIPFLETLLFIAILVVTPWQLQELLPVVLTRLVMHTMPLAVLWMCLVPPWREFFASRPDTHPR